jgi:hypothetical protein
MAKDTGKVNIHGKEYETVASRVNRFREEHKQELSITTEIVDRNDAEVVVRAVISAKDGFVIATGYAEEKRAASQINRTSALENAETSAIGRALANFGIGGTEFASADEVANAIGQQQTGSFKEPAKDYGNAVRRPTDKQLNMIRAISSKLGIEKVAIEGRIMTLDTSEQASAAIDALQAKLDAKEGGE